MKKRSLEIPPQLLLFLHLHLLATSMLGDLALARRWLRRAVTGWWGPNRKLCEVLGVPLDRARAKGTQGTRWWQNAALWYAANPSVCLAEGSEIPQILGEPDAPRLNGLWVQEESRALRVLIPDVWSPCESITRLIDYHATLLFADEILKAAVDRRQLGYLVVLPSDEKKRRLRDFIQRRDLGYFELFPLRLVVLEGML